MDIVTELTSEEEQATAIGLRLQFGEDLVDWGVYPHRGGVTFCVVVKVEQRPMGIGWTRETPAERRAFRYELAGIRWGYLDHKWDDYKREYTCWFGKATRLGET